MGKVRRGGYIFLWWIGDHKPRHVHVYRDNTLVTRINLDTMEAMDMPRVERKILDIIRDLKSEGRL